jgi:hypothetical protein
MYIPKRYGESRVSACPFCGASAYAKNKQGIPVCADHKNETMQDMKCACGKWLDMREGKFGPFFVCEKCGIVSMQKAREINPQVSASQQRVARANAFKDENGRDVFVRSDDPRFGFR